jgi:predicted RNase H-like HicB family nuclease
MSARSKESSGKKALDRPFAPDVLAKARELAARYQMILWYEDGEWYGRGLEMPHVYGDGRTPAQCIEDTREAFVGMAATLLERGEKPPAPAKSGQRTAQVNVRLTAEEKALLEAVAERKGFSGLSDFIRASVLQAAG